jgi:hypothetical protein
VLWVPVLKGKKLWSNDCLPNPMACSPNTMAQKILQAQEAPSDHGERACPFLKRKKNLGWALDDALNDEEVVVTMVFSCGYYSTTTNGNPPSLGVSSQKISKKRLYFFSFSFIYLEMIGTRNFSFNFLISRMRQNVPKTTKFSQDNRKTKLCILRVW